MEGNPRRSRHLRLLLINPRFRESFWSFKWALDEILPRKRALNPPLGLATVAALTPSHWTVEIVDENVEPVPLAPRADVVGICGMGVQFARQAELLRHYGARGHYTVAGGSFASLCPERYAELAHTVIAGEAEYTWPEFCRDFERGRPRALYRETGNVRLADSPVPRFDLLKLERYTSATLQFSRGCPYRCEFCDIIVMFGRKPRHKSPERIGRELDALRARGVRSVFFVDDNLIGHRPGALELLRFLGEYQDRHGRPFLFGTEVSLNVAQDAELLRLFRRANFTWVFIGIESPDPEALRATRKTQNLREDPLASVRRIYAHGIDVLAGFIVGFDTDTPRCFEHQRRFIRASGIQVAMIGLLTALPRTPLHERLAREGRLIAQAEGADNTKASTNIVPKGMSYAELIEGYCTLYRRLFSDRGIAERLKSKLRYLRDPVYRGDYRLREQAAIIARLLVKGIAPGGWRRAWHFTRSLPWRAPAKFPLAVMDWIAGLAMRDYVDRHFGTPRTTDAGAARRWLASAERALHRYIESGAASVTLTASPGSALQLRLRLAGALDAAFFSRCARRLVPLMRNTRVSVTLAIESIEPLHLPRLERLLERLARYGERVFIELADPLHRIVRVDSSVFNLVLARGPR